MSEKLTMESAQALIDAGDEAGLLALCEGLIYHVARRWRNVTAAIGLEDLQQTARMAALKRVRAWIVAGHGPTGCKPSTEICRYAERDIKRSVAYTLGVGEREIMAKGWLAKRGITDVEEAMSRSDRPGYMRKRSVIVAALRLEAPVPLDPERDVAANPPEDLGSALALADELLARAGLSREDALPLLAACGLADGERDPVAARRVAAMIRRACKPAPVHRMPTRTQPAATQLTLWEAVA